MLATITGIAGWHKIRCPISSSARERNHMILRDGALREHDTAISAFPSMELNARDPLSIGVRTLCASLSVFVLLLQPATFERIGLAPFFIIATFLFLVLQAVDAIFLSSAFYVTQSGASLLGGMFFWIFFLPLALSSFVTFRILKSPLFGFVKALLMILSAPELSSLALFFRILPVGFFTELSHSIWMFFFPCLASIAMALFVDLKPSTVSYFRLFSAASEGFWASGHVLAGL